ncbi:carbonic anhydrase family protein [Cupriavidus sp.]|uniref:carbonic anhydrase n=1 Tax=Cupriavidus sp. TaxID=1873897 RepID=UPI0031D5FE92
MTHTLRAAAFCGAIVLGSASAIATPPPPGHDPHAWSYEGATDPSHWGELDPGFFRCATGEQQSPVDIHGATPAHLPPLAFHYRPTRAKVVNTGHTIEVRPAGDETLTTATGTYRLAQFHFHTPSETRFNGKAYPLSAHFVHQDDQGRVVAVVAVMFRMGKPNPQLATLFRTLPGQGAQPVQMPGRVNIAGLLPKSHNYYTFPGSLTTPPCTEDVRWYVMKQPLTISPQQLAAFRSRYPMNARPLQPLDGREIQSGN